MTVINESDLSAAIAAYETSTADAITKAKQVRLPEPIAFIFSTLGLTFASSAALAAKLPTGQTKADRGAEYLYIFRIADDNKVPLDEVMRAFQLARDKQEESDYSGPKNLCRENHWAAGCKVLYVGRSYAPRERFKAHLRAGKSGTYAVHFEQWASCMDLRVQFSMYRLPRVGDRVVQVIEDGLWDLLRPTLGRRGEK